MFSADSGFDAIPFRRYAMWAQAFKVAVIGFSVVFLSLSILAISVWLTSLFFRQADVKAEEVQK